MTPRTRDWQERLEALVKERQGAPFAWGSNDCATFAADAVEAMTGERHLPQLRGLGAREALEVLQERGGVRELAREALGEPIPVRLARRGDVVVLEFGGREALAVCNGTSAVAPGPDGLVAVSMKQARAAWRVG